MVAAESSTVNALLALAGVTITAALGFAAVLVQQRRTQNKVDRVYDHVNRSEQQMGVESGAAMTFREEMRAGFSRNEEVHEDLKAGIADVAEHVVEDERRISRVEREIGVDDGRRRER